MSSFNGGFRLGDIQASFLDRNGRAKHTKRDKESEHNKTNITNLSRLSCVTDHSYVGRYIPLPMTMRKGSILKFQDKSNDFNTR